MKQGPPHPTPWKVRNINGEIVILDGDARQIHLDQRSVEHMVRCVNAVEALGVTLRDTDTLRARASS